MRGKSIATLLLSFFILFVSILPVTLIAQGGPGGGGGVGDPACDPQCNCRPDGSICPIDSYLYLLIGIGLLYGIKKVRDQKKIIEE